MDVRQDPRAQLDWLRRVRPTCLLSLPSNLELLAGLLRDKGERLPNLQVVQTFGEPLWEASRQRIEEGFGVPTKNNYGTTEAGHIASPCPMGHGLHVHSENLIAEVLDAENQPCRPGETGRLVFTTLHNFLAPFVRYDILDDVTLAERAVSLRPRSSAMDRTSRAASTRCSTCPMAGGDRRWVLPFESGRWGGPPIPDHPTGGCARRHSRRAGPYVDGRSRPADAGGGAARARLRHPGGHRTKGVARTLTRRKAENRRPREGNGMSDGANRSDALHENYIRRWNLVGPPLRPSWEDLQLIQEEIDELVPRPRRIGGAGVDPWRDSGTGGARLAEAQPRLRGGPVDRDDPIDLVHLGATREGRGGRRLGNLPNPGSILRSAGGRRKFRVLGRGRMGIAVCSTRRCGR